MAIFSLSVCSAYAAGVGKDGTIAAKRGKATTIAELIAMYDSTGCIDCHEDIHDEWANSAHSRPVYGTGRTAATMKTALENGVLSWAYSGAEKPEDVEVEHLMGCAKCHLPQLADATDAVAKEFISEIYGLMDAYRNQDETKFDNIKNTLLSLNINCLICHNRMASTRIRLSLTPRSARS
jgi:cytochrome c553